MWLALALFEFFMDVTGTYYDINLYTLCRACLCSNGEMLDLMIGGERQRNLLDMYAMVTGLEVSATLHLPFRVCTQCESKIGASYSFRQQCRINDELIQQYYRSQPQKLMQNGMDTLTYLNPCELAPPFAPIGMHDISQPVIDARPDLLPQYGYDPHPFMDTSKELQPTDIDVGDNSNEVDDIVDVEGAIDVDDFSPLPAEPEGEKPKQTMRLQQFSYDEVNEAIESTRRPTSKDLECIKCGFVGSTNRALSVHVSLLHKDMKETYCTTCNREFDNLSDHQKEHKIIDMKCKFCEKQFATKGHLTEHLRSHTEVRPYKCDTCSKGFISTRHLKVHQRVHTKDRPFKCPQCPKSFNQASSLKHHQKRHIDNDELTITCPSCRETFSTKEREQHTCSSENVRDSKTGTNWTLPQNFCKECNKKVRSLSVHQNKVHGTEGEAFNKKCADGKLCTVCGKQFKTNTKLKIHMRLHTGEAPYKCLYCDKKVSTRNHLVVHERTHTGEKPHVCHICGKGFAQSSVLNTHMRLHTGRPEECKICGQRFCRPAELRLHMRRHTGEKPYKCKECTQSFVQRSHLIEHSKTHSDERPYKCDFCGRGFKQNSSLKAHVQIHLGYKPYQCSQCSYACRQSYSLTQHMKQHIDDAPRADKPHICNLCGRGFSTLAMMNSHANSVHAPPASEVQY